MQLGMRVAELFGRRVDGRAIAWARALIGVDCVLRGFEAWGILERVLAPGHLRLSYVSWAIAPSLDALPLYIAVWIGLALAFAGGWLTLVSGPVLSALMGYTLLVDQQTYSNHLYLLSLVVALLTVAESHRRPSLEGADPDATTVPAWSVMLLKLQVSIVYIFGAVSKINFAFLSGAVLYLNLRPSLKGMVGHFPPVLLVMAAASILLELWLAAALWSPRWRTRAVSIGIAFHVGIVLSLRTSESVQLIVFTTLMSTLYLQFFSHTPRHVTVYYDDSCGVCARVIGWFLARQRQPWIAAIGSTSGAAFQHDTSKFDLQQSILLVDYESGEYATGSRAFAALVKALPVVYQPLRIAALPGFVLVSDAVYGLIAKRRHEISSRLGLDRCAVAPSIGQRS